MSNKLMTGKVKYVKLRNGNVAALPVGYQHFVIAYLEGLQVKLAMASVTGIVMPDDTVESYNKTQCWYGGKILKELTYQEALHELMVNEFGEEPAENVLSCYSGEEKLLLEDAFKAAGFSDIETFDDEDFDE